MIKKTTLKNGLRVITAPIRSASGAAAILVLVGAGSRYEKKELNGISHFLEHMFFKGTKKRPSTLKIAETLDRVGGEYNAFTSKEFTGYWAKVEKSHLGLAVDLISDIFLNSKLAPKDIEKERGVIIAERNMYLDTPTSFISDLFEALIYGNQPAGWSVIGAKNNILGFKRKDFLYYLRNHYSPLNTVICAAGNFSEEKFLEKIKKLFSAVKRNSLLPKNKVIEKQYKPEALLKFKKTGQSHLYLGVRGYGINSQEKYSQELISIILGGNMSSRLFISVREKRGLSYYIKTFSETYTDSGYLATKIGVPHKAVKEAISLILKEYKNMREKKISAKELKKAKEYLKGISVLGLEGSDDQAMFYAAQELLLGKILTLKEKFAKIEAVTASDIQKTARNIFKPENLNFAMIGPHRTKEMFEKMLKF